MTKKLDVFDAQKARVGTSVTRTLDRWNTLINSAFPATDEWLDTFDAIADDELDKADAERHDDIVYEGEE